MSPPAERGSGYHRHGMGVSEFQGTERFTIVRRLGAGGMGVVYEALDRERDARVALKTLQSRDPDSLLRFKHEFHSLADLHHPNLVTLGELFAEDPVWFFTMDLVDGTDLLEWVTPDQAVEALTEHAPSAGVTAASRSKPGVSTAGGQKQDTLTP